MGLRWRLASALREQRFPARRWELITLADYNGADGRTQRDLRALPDGVYRCFDHVVRAVEQANTDARPMGVR
jgi:hypothetical protein